MKHLPTSLLLLSGGAPALSKIWREEREGEIGKRGKEREGGMEREREEDLEREREKVRGRRKEK